MLGQDDQHRLRQSDSPQLHREDSTVHPGLDGPFSVDSASNDTLTTIHQNQAGTYKETCGAVSVTRCDTDSQLLEASTARANNKCNKHRCHNSNNANASSIAHAEMDKMSVNRTPDFGEDTPPLVESSDDPDTEASSTAEGGSSDLEDMPPQLESSDDSKVEATESTAPNITI